MLKEGWDISSTLSMNQPDETRETFIIIERLSHSHYYNMSDVLAGKISHSEHLTHHLASGEASVQAIHSGSAESASHTAAYL